MRAEGEEVSRAADAQAMDAKTVLGTVLEKLKGVVGVGVWAFGASLVFFYAIKATMGMRVSAEEEMEGLDIGEHGISAYPDFATHGASYGGPSSVMAAGAASAALAGKPAMAKS